MADLSKLSIAPDQRDLRQQHQSIAPLQFRKKRMMTVDITSEFFVAASGRCGPQGWVKLYRTQRWFQTALDTGQLVKDEHFTLFEAVGALEVSVQSWNGGVHGMIYMSTAERSW